MTEPPLCPCHGLPMTWNADKRRTGGGWWRCREKRREYNKRRHAQRIAWMREDYHTSPRQYIAARRRQLAASRENVLARLDKLRREAEDSDVTEP